MNFFKKGFFQTTIKKHRYAFFFPNLIYLQLSHDTHTSLSMKISKLYIILYNAVMFCGWAFVYGKGLLCYGRTLASGDAGKLSGELLWGEYGEWLFLFQMLMLLDVVNSLLRVVRSPVGTTIMQVASRILVIAVLKVFPQSRTTLVGMSLLLFAWCPTECIRYSFYLIKELRTGSEKKVEKKKGDEKKAVTKKSDDKGVPKWLLWIRYSSFIIFYPMGITGELFVLYTSLGEIREQPSPLNLVQWIIYGAFCVYPFGAFVLFTYMLKQRKKTLYPKPEEKKI